MALFKNFFKGLRLKPTDSGPNPAGADPTDNLEGSIWVYANKLKAYINSSIRVLVFEDETQTLTNKTIGDTNTINAQDDAFTIDDASDATLQIDFNAAGTTATKTTITSSQTANRVITLPDATDTLVGKTTTDTFTNKTIGDNNTVNAQDDAFSIQDASDPTLYIDFNAAGTTGTKSTITSSQTSNQIITLPDATDTLVGKATTDILTNKTIDAEGTGNTLSNISDTNIKAGAAIDAAKIHDGSVSNTEFGYISTVSSNVQDQLDSKSADSSVVHNTGNENIGGIKTFTDTTESTTKDNGAMIVEGGVGIEKNLNVGGNVAITGTLQVDGTTTTVNSTTLEVTDPNIIVNNGGNQASANSAIAGLTVEMSDATDAIIGYDSSLTSKFKCGELGSEIEIADVSSSQTLTNKIIDGDNNTISNLEHGAEVDNPSSGVHGVSGTIVGTSDSQVLTNKVLVDDNVYFGDSADNTKKLEVELAGATTAKTMTFISSHTDDRSITFPDTTDTLVCKDTTDTLTNKTLTSPVLNSPSIVTPSRSDVKQDTDANLTTYASSATNGQLCFATDSKKMYQVKDSALEELGAGTGSGDANTIHLLESDNLIIGDIDLTGNNSDFDGGGSIAGTLSLSSTSTELLKSSSQVIKYDADGNDGSDDYFGFTKSIPLAYRGRNIGFQFEYKNDSTTNDDDFRFCVKIKDGANAGNITYFNLETKYSSNNEGITFKESSYIPSDCTEIEFGWQNTDTTTTIILIVDNILITSNPYIDKNLLDTQTIRLHTTNGHGSTNTCIRRWTTTVENIGENLITYTDSSTLGASFTINRNGIYTITYGDQYNTNKEFGISLNSSELTSAIYLITTADRLAWAVTRGPNESQTVSWSGYLEIGDIIRTHDSAGTDGTNTERAFFTITGQAEKEAVAHSNTIPENLYSARITSADAITSQNLDFISSVSSGSTGIYVITYESGFFTETPSVIANAETDGLYCTITSESSSGCTVTIKTDAGVATDSDFSIQAQRQGTDYKPLTGNIITPIAQIAYIKDIKADNTAGGTFTQDVWQTRVLNDLSGDINFVNLSSNQFTLEAGIYDIYASAPAYNVMFHQLRLRNITDSTTNIEGNSLKSDNATYIENKATLMGKLTLSSSKTFEIQHFCSATFATYGFGTGADTTGENNVFTQVRVTKYK